MRMPLTFDSRFWQRKQLWCQPPISNLGFPNKFHFRKTPFVKRHFSETAVENSTTVYQINEQVTVHRNRRTNARKAKQLCFWRSGQIQPFDQNYKKNLNTTESWVSCWWCFLVVESCRVCDGCTPFCSRKYFPAIFLISGLNFLINGFLYADADAGNWKLMGFFFFLFLFFCFFPKGCFFFSQLQNMPNLFFGAKMGIFLEPNMKLVIPNPLLGWCWDGGGAPTNKVKQKTQNR